MGAGRERKGSSGGLDGNRSIHEQHIRSNGEVT